ncbi:MAG: hypothetical protein LBT17_02660, partial [Mycoplasmataceae bacterium]|nr:hypothetical protein [Mycoplasmataceae bacterium]
MRRKTEKKLNIKTIKTIKIASTICGAALIVCSSIWCGVANSANNHNQIMASQNQMSQSKSSSSTPAYDIESAIPNDKVSLPNNKNEMGSIQFHTNQTLLRFSTIGTWDRKFTGWQDYNYLVDQNVIKDDLSLAALSVGGETNLNFGTVNLSLTGDFNYSNTINLIATQWKLNSIAKTYFEYDLGNNVSLQMTTVNNVGTPINIKDYIQLQMDSYHNVTMHFIQNVYFEMSLFVKNNDGTNAYAWDNVMDVVHSNKNTTFESLMNIGKFWTESSVPTLNIDLQGWYYTSSVRHPCPINVNDCSATYSFSGIGENQIMHFEDLDGNEISNNQWSMICNNLTITAVGGVDGCWPSSYKNPTINVADDEINITQRGWKPYDVNPATGPETFADGWISITLFDSS